MKKLHLLEEHGILIGLGHGGAGGSLGFGDPDNHVSIGFVMNQMHPGITAWETATSFIEKVYESK